MEHLAQDLTVALEESESCGPIVLEPSRRWGMRRRTRSAGNLSMIIHNLKLPEIYANNKSGDNQSEDSSSTNSEVNSNSKKHRNKKNRDHNHSDSDDGPLTFSVSRVISSRSQSLRMKHNIHPFFRGRYNKLGLSHSLESDSFNENSPARPNLRRKRKLRRMNVDETPIPSCGKRKRPQRFEIIENGRAVRYTTKIKPLHQSVVEKIEKFCSPADFECNRMETQCIENCDNASESSLSWSGGEGHEGDDELTDWAPSQDSSSLIDSVPWNDADPREIRAGCRRLRDERSGFSISTSANEKVAKFMQDSSKIEIRIFGADKEKLAQLAELYSLELWFEGPSSLLRKTLRTPCMQPIQRHHSNHNAGHKRIRTHDHKNQSEDQSEVDDK